MQIRGRDNSNWGRDDYTQGVERPDPNLIETSLTLDLKTQNPRNMRFSNEYLSKSLTPLSRNLKYFTSKSHLNINIPLLDKT